MGSLRSFNPRQTAIRRDLLIGLGVAILLTAGVLAYISQSPDVEKDRAEGIRLLNLKKYSEARPKLEFCLTADPADVVARQALIQIAVAEERFDEALVLLDGLAKLRPDDVDLYSLRGRIHGTLSHKPEALSDYLRVIEL